MEISWLSEVKACFPTGLFLGVCSVKQEKVSALSLKPDPGKRTGCEREDNRVFPSRSAENPTEAYSMGFASRKVFLGLLCKRLSGSKD